MRRDQATGHSGLPSGAADHGTVRVRRVLLSRGHRRLHALYNALTANPLDAANSRRRVNYACRTLRSATQANVTQQA